MQRRQIWLLIGLMFTAVLAAGIASTTRTEAAHSSVWGAAPGVPPVQVRHPDLVASALKSDTSPPLRSLRVLRYGVYKDDHDNPVIRNVKANPGAIDTAIQRILGALAMPAPIQNFDGQYNTNGPLPPDTNGDVGRDYYVQIVNSTFEIFSKTGASLYGPANNSTLFIGFGGLCETHNDGDPVAMYDALADRWVLTWFTSAAPYMECIAVSSSPDPTGSWYRYAFADNNSGTTLGDYPKMTVWPDAYYMTTNEFNPNFVGDGNYAYNRAKMLRGDPTAEVVYFHGSDGGKLPSDVDSANAPPPAGSPNYILDWYNNSPGQLAEYKFHVDFATPANSTYTGPFLISVANFDPNAPSVPQPGTTTMLDNLSDRLMFRLAYRNFGTYESLVVNHTVNAGGVDGIRWYELRDPNNAGGASVFQQGTYAPADGLYRWMGSIAQDRAGDIALGFSFGNAATFPGIRYAGRLVSDPPGVLSQGEATLLDGTGSEDYPAAHRWGDYSAMQIDPVDDCTFWYTQMYWERTGERNWRTHIGSFKFPSCSAQPSPTPVATATGLPATATNTPGPSPTACPGSVDVTDSITNTDPTQAGRLRVSDPKSSCAVPKTAPSLSDNLTRHYKSYSYTNTSGSAECVTVQMSQACGDNAVQSIAYLGTFDPNNIQTNYLADGGASGPNFQYSFTLGAGQTAQVVVLEVSPNLGCTSYSLIVSSCSVQAGTATPVATSTAEASATPASPTDTPPPIGSPPATDTPVASSTATASSTAEASATPVASSTAVATSTAMASSTPAASATPCAITFTDVHTTDYFYTAVEYLACHGVISGYADHTFRPYNNTTRSQMVKIVVLGLNVAPYTPPSGGYTFTDVQPGNPFFSYVEAAAHANIVSGYNCGSVLSEPCDTENRPYFRPYANVTRGQLAKITVVAAGWHLLNPPTGTFSDVPPQSAFYPFIETAVCHGIISGYADGTFRPANNATRGQIAKIVYLALTGGPGSCETPTAVK